MKFKFKTNDNANLAYIITPLTPKDIKTSAVKNLLKAENIPSAAIDAFKAKKGEVLELFGQKTEKIILLGLGEHLKYQDICSAFSQLSFNKKTSLPNQIGIQLEVSEFRKDRKLVQTIIEASIHGLLLGTYDIGLYKTDAPTTHALLDKKASISFLSSLDKKDLESSANTGKAKAETQIRIKDLVNAPGNKAIPETLAQWAIESGQTYGFSTSVMYKSQIEDAKLDALLAVNRGSEHPPAFIIMEYKPKEKNVKKVGLIGKGVTFDTGGVSIKGSQNMHYMKSDMGGAAAVLGALELTAKLQLPVHLIGIVPTTDNCVDATAIKPGDVINSYSGKTIEVINTDAEGRLILADGLAYMEKNFSPDIMIDLATLTGSSVRALGYQAAALFTNNKAISNQLSKIGEKFGERVWQLPLWDEYHSDLHSDVADISNLGASPVAGAITAAKFLEFFTNNHPAWAHLDIAGVAFGNNPFSKQKSATGYGVNLLVEYFKQLSTK